MSYAGLYRPGRSVLHRTPAGVKLLALAAGGIGLLSVRSPVAVAVAAVVVVGLYALGRVGPAAAWAQVRPVRWFALVLLVVQLLLTDVATAIGLTARLLLLVALAGLVTLTTRTSALMSAIEAAVGPLRRFGVDPARVSLLLALAVRSVPVLAELAVQVRDAQRARGRRRSVRAFAVPLLVGALRRADALGEALAARGLDD